MPVCSGASAMSSSNLSCDDAGRPLRPQPLVDKPALAPQGPQDVEHELQHRNSSDVNASPEKPPYLGRRRSRPTTPRSGPNRSVRVASPPPVGPVPHATGPDADSQVG